MKFENGDEKLLRLLTDNPEEGIYALQKRYGGLIYRIIAGILPGHQEDIEEVASDVLAAAWQQAETIALHKKPLGPWLTVTARNRAIDRYRFLSRRYTIELDEDIVFMVDTCTSEGEDLIAGLVADMVNPDREIFLRRYYRMETAAEIGAALGMDAHTVNVRLSRGRRKLKKKYLNQMGKERPEHAE